MDKENKDNSSLNHSNLVINVNIIKTMQEYLKTVETPGLDRAMEIITNPNFLKDDELNNYKKINKIKISC